MNLDEIIKQCESIVTDPDPKSETWMMDLAKAAEFGRKAAPALKIAIEALRNLSPYRRRLSEGHMREIAREAIEAITEEFSK